MESNHDFFLKEDYRVDKLNMDAAEGSADPTCLIFKDLKGSLVIKTTLFGLISTCIPFVMTDVTFLFSGFPLKSILQWEPSAEPFFGVL